jgi:hypothetical protein
MAPGGIAENRLREIARRADTNKNQLTIMPGLLSSLPSCMYQFA